MGKKLSKEEGQETHQGQPGQAPAPGGNNHPSSQASSNSGNTDGIFFHKIDSQLM
jgi:hypothetical protein